MNPKNYRYDHYYDWPVPNIQAKIGKGKRRQRILKKKRERTTWSRIKYLCHYTPLGDRFAGPRKWF